VGRINGGGSAISNARTLVAQPGFPSGREARIGDRGSEPATPGSGLTNRKNLPSFPVTSKPSAPVSTRQPKEADLRLPKKDAPVDDVKTKKVCADKNCPVSCPDGSYLGANGACVSAGASNGPDYCADGRIVSSTGFCYPPEAFSSIASRSRCDWLRDQLERQRRDAERAQARAESSCASDPISNKCGKLNEKFQDAWERVQRTQQEYYLCRP